MLLRDNPFYVIGVSMRDSQAKIIDKAEDAALKQDEELCRNAKTVLLNPNKRIEAEIAWLPGMGPKLVGKILYALEYSPKEILNCEFLLDENYCCARANSLLNGLVSTKNLNAGDIGIIIAAISTAFAGINAEVLLDTINEARDIAGIPFVPNVSNLEDALRERKHFFVKNIKNVMNDMATEEMVSMLTDVVDMDTDSGKNQGTEIIEDLVVAYGLEAQPFFDKANLTIDCLVESIKKDAKNNVPDSSLQKKVNQLIDIVKQWDKIAQPIQVSFLSQGLEHEESKKIANMVRELTIKLFNEHGKMQAAQAITQMMNEVFAEVRTVAERTKQDAKDLKDIEQSRIASKEEEEKERQYLNYSTTFGLILTKTVRMTPELIEFNGRKMELADIKHITWGGVRNSTNGVSTGTDYTIKMQCTENRSFVVAFSGHEEVFLNLIDRLWKTVGIKVLLDMLEKLEKGEKIRFGNALVSDDGIVLASDSWFSRETEFCPWTSAEVFSGPGYFCIRDIKNKSMVTKLEYLETQDAHILENLVRMGFSKGIRKLSNTLGV